jgi:hypothetical protein
MATETEIEASVAGLLRETEAAHAVYERDALGGVYDEDWPAWYAAYLREHGLLDVLPRAAALGAEGIAALLAQLDREYRQSQPAEEWPVVYARHLAATLA